MPVTKKLRIVVEGIGQVVQKYYKFPLGAIKTKHPQVSIVFTDDSSYWKNDPKVSVKNKKFIKELQGWAKYIDKSKEKEKYEKLKADVVFIATPDFTHSELTKHWLEPANRCQQIFVEKPLDSDLSKARDLVYLNNHTNKIIAVDHYRVRMLYFLLGGRIEEIIKNHLGDKVKNITFYMLEDGTTQSDLDPIRAEGRVKSLNEGLILDMMPHALAIMDKFFPIELMKITELRAGKYSVIGSDGKVAESEIEWETFAHIGFRYDGTKYFIGSDFIEGEIFVGKGVGGSRDLEKYGEVKLLELTGANGCKCTFDFRTPKFDNVTDGIGSVIITNARGERKKIGELEDHAYQLLFTRVIRQWQVSDTDLEFDLSVRKAKNFLIMLDDIRHGVRMIKEKLGKLPTYSIDNRKGSPMLEEIKKKLPSISSVFSHKNNSRIHPKRLT